MCLVGFADWLSWTPATDSINAELERLFQSYFMMSQVSPNGLGLATYSNISGVGLERLNIASNQRLRLLRRLIERNLEFALAAAGLPSTDLRWRDEKFSTETERIDAFLKLREAGLMSDDEIKAELFGRA